ncbi:C4-dicarboxylate ABC transporter substrate-binding protein [Marinobacterium nitratireducens]|uniref:C4-dicarboxylate ABC transporter substrate-binding protein n=1 Tax=Marinobacterium nitratireducens TaxID=518897 RepID=A0A918DWD9_9GAMM|nr:TRAP transporter substrate-binding protein [Marinobacterium nitratireducens]GGO86542.1 C4-dicarboxylate ABC transporter substrate-binding protein [Marinobacterium nitratireducens]
MNLKKWAAAAITGYALSAMPALAADVTLRFAHPWPGNSDIAKGLEAWGDSLQVASDNRIEVEFYPAQTLTKAAKGYDAVVGQIADVAATVQGYTANRFPLTQVIELPGLVDNAAQGSCVLQKLYDEGDIAGEYEDSHVLFVWTNGPGHLHLNGKSVRTPEDISGLRIRRPTTVVGQLLENLGAQPVGMPAPDAYTALQRGVIDGVAISWDGAMVFRLNEVADHHTELNLYSLSFVVTMNKGVYERLPDDLKAIVDQHSGEKWSQHMARIFDDLDQQSLQNVKERGDEVIELDSAIQAAWQPALEQVTESYLEEQEGLGLPAREVYGKARTLSESCRA